MDEKWTQRMMRGLRYGIAALACASALSILLTPHASHAQATPGNMADLRIDDSAAQLGVEAARRGDYATGIELLMPVFEKDASYLVSEHVPAGYWLGHALLQTENVPNALHVWHRTLRTLREGSVAWSRTANAFVRATFDTGVPAYHDVAAQVYLTLVERVDEVEASAPVHGALMQHVLEATYVLPDAVKRRIGIDPRGDVRDASRLALSDTAGAVLAAWWRQQDRSVASASNERLVEHLSRVAEARALYMHDGAIDARGRVYIRLGPPPIELDVTFSDYPVMQREVILAQPNISSFDFSPGIYWEYDNLGTVAHFLFVESEEGDRYELGTVADMIPRHIRRNFSGREGNVYSYLRSMEVALRQLSVYNPRYMGRYAEVENYIAYYKTGGGIDFPDPGSQAASVSQRNTNEDHQLKRERREAVGASQSNVDASYPAIDVQMRWARFLNEDGNTRTEIYWTAPADALNPRTAMDADAFEVEDMEVDPDEIDGASRIVASTRLEDENHRAARQASRQTQVPAPETDALGSNWLPPQTLAIAAEGTPFHLGVQWDQRLGETAESAGNLLLRRATTRIDTLAQLRADAATLEMSDIKLVEARPDAIAAGTAGAELPPYPRQQVPGDTPLGIYFEVYHLMFDEADRARYTVDINVDRVQPRSGLGGLVRSDEQMETTTTTTNETTRRRTQELLLLDMDAWPEAATEEEVTLTVRVTDEVSGASVERSTTLSVVRDDA